MKTKFLGPLGLSAAFVMAVPQLLPAAEPHHHEHAPAAGTETTGLTLNQGKKWATDQALRESMAELRAAFAASLHQIHAGALPPQQYKALSDKITTQLARIVAECKLPAQADAVLHILLSELAEAAKGMQGGTAAETQAAAQKAIKALNDYGRYFDHPKWHDLKH